ncbi:unnamed protein product [Diamesa serratosioi]
MENDSTNTVVKRHRKPFLGILIRRSTKVEPQNIPQNNSSDDSLVEQQPQYSEHKNLLDHQENIKNENSSKNKKLLERNNTCPSLNVHNINNKSSSSKLKDEMKLTDTPNVNRYSFCCTVDEPKLSASSLEVQLLNGHINSDSGIEATASNIEESSTPSPSRVPSSARPLEVNNHGTSHYVLPSYESYPSPILLSCRSRFREKFLPPAEPFNSLKDQHNSTPDIPTHSSARRESRPKSAGSFDMIAFNNEKGAKSLKNNNDQKTPVSADSLAHSALMAAHVLHLIPTEKARQRNFLQGRLASNSLLGNAELEKALPTREVTIFVGSWNMNGQNPPKQMNDFVLPTGLTYVPDLFVIGTQESCSERFEWEVTLQETLGPSHVLLHSTSLGTLHLAVFIRRDLIWFCSEPEDASLSVRPGSAFRTKGAVAISFCLFGTSFLFVTSHLTAHQQKVKERVQDIKRIIHALDLPRNITLRHRNKDVTQNFDSVYWCGDLNFRLSEPRANLLKWIETTKFPLPAHLPHGFLHTDQLTSVLADGAAFKGFKEAKISFPPTYKYDVGTQHFDTSSKQRAPAYTDRILYKYKLPPIGFRRTSALINSDSRSSTPPSPITCIAYDSVQSIISSDHKPVWALFRNALRPGIDSIPLAAGLFNREVYIEGIKHRLDNSFSEPSTGCSIQ